MNFGSYIHKILEDGYTCSHISDLEKLAKKYKAQYKISAGYSKKTQKCLENFFKFNKKLESTLGVEDVYEVELVEGIFQNGIIDRIVKGKSGGLLVIDYKTGKREKTKFQLMNDLQLQGYAYAVHKKFGVPIEKITCAHYYPVTGHFIPVKYGKKTIHQWKSKIIEGVWKIRKAKLTDLCASRNQYCDWCDHKKICPLYEKDPRKLQYLLENTKKRERRPKK